MDGGARFFSSGNSNLLSICYICICVCVCIYTHIYMRYLRTTNESHWASTPVFCVYQIRCCCRRRRHSAITTSQKNRPTGIASTLYIQISQNIFLSWRVGHLLRMDTAIWRWARVDCLCFTHIAALKCSYKSVHGVEWRLCYFRDARTAPRTCFNLGEYEDKKQMFGNISNW